MDRCAILDELELAILRGATVAITLYSGDAVVDRPLAIAARAGDDHVTLAGGAEVAVSAIARVAPMP
jgi:hypothetical protein